MSNYSQRMTIIILLYVFCLSCSSLVPHFLFLVSLYFVDLCSDVFSFSFSFFFSLFLLFILYRYFLCGYHEAYVKHFITVYFKLITTSITCTILQFYLFITFDIKLHIFMLFIHSKIFVFIIVYTFFFLLLWYT